MHDRLTRADIQKMKEELEHRILVVRKEALEDVKTARAHGDLSENFEYKAAKQFKNQNESRIRYLEGMIKTAIVIEDERAIDEAGINKRVTVRFEGEEETEDYVLVTSIRGNSMQGYITIESPVGRALVGKRAGDTAHVTLPDGGGYDLEVVSVSADVDDDTIEIRRF